MNLSPNLTLLLLTHNESKNIKDNFGWVGECPAINEIVVVDDQSIDTTVSDVRKLATKHLKVKVLSQSLNGDFAAQRQAGVTAATNDWIFWLDADEIPSPELIKYLNCFQIKSYQAVSFPRSTIFMGRQLRFGETGSAVFVRLFNRKNGHFAGNVHEIWQYFGTTQQHHSKIIHLSPPTLRSFLEKINLYSTIRSKELFNRKVHSNTIQIIVYPLVKFLSNYIFRLGFLDGVPGLILALSMSFHSFLVRAKLWHLWNP